MAWDQTEAEKLHKEGLTQEQIGFALGRIAEHRMQADREGYSRGYENGKLDWKGVREKPKPTVERKKIIEGIAKFYLNRSQKASNTWNEAVIKTTVAIRNLGICNLHVRNDEGKTTVVITLERPGLLIGKRGENIDELSKYLNADVRIVEDNTVFSEIMAHLPMEEQ